MSTIDTGIIFAYMAMMILIGLYASRKQDNVEDYFVASGKIGTISVACLWLSSYVGGAAIIAGAANAYDMGISAGWYIGAMIIGCAAFGFFFAARVKRLGKENSFLTYPEMMESRYDSRTRIVATITTIAAFVGYAAGQLVAAALILQTLLGWDYGTSLALASAIIVLYTATGGFLAITYTDWVQISILFIGVVFIGLPIAIASGGTWTALTTTLPSSYFDIGTWGWDKIVPLTVSIALAFFVAMDSFTRCFAARTEGIARNGTYLAAALLVPLMVASIWLGMTSKLLFPEVSDSADILTMFVMEQFPVGLKGLLLVGMLAALMSTADICILTASANASQDIYQRYVNPQVDPKTLYRFSMVMSAVVGVVATLMAWKMRNIIDVLLLAFTINSAALFVPTVAMVYFKRISKPAAFWSITCALFTVITWHIGGTMNVASIFEIDPLWPGLAVSIILFTGISQSGETTE